MNPLQELGLRDIHLPEQPGWWPPAPGWWLVLMLLLAAALAAFLLVRRHRRLRPLRMARAELQRLRQDWAENHGVDAEWLARLSRLLRRVGLACDEPAQLAGLAGEEWLAWLDQPLGGDGFRRGPGRVLELGPYRRDPAVEDPEALLELCERWLGAMQRKPR